MDMDYSLQIVAATYAVFYLEKAISDIDRHIDNLPSDDEKISDPKLELTKDDFKNGEIIIRKGKKVYHKVILK